MSSLMKAALVFAGGVAFCTVILIIRLVGIADTKYLGVVEQNAQTSVYEGTETFRVATRRDFDDLCLQYSKAKTPDEKQTIVSLIQHRISASPADLVPSCARTIAGSL